MVTPEMTRRAGVSRGVIFRGQGEVGAKLKLNTDMRLAPFNLDLLEISSSEFSCEYGRSRVKYLRKVLPDGEVPQHLFEHFPCADKVFMVVPKIMIFIENLCFRLFLEGVRCKRRKNSLRNFVGGQAESALRVISRGNIG